MYTKSKDGQMRADHHFAIRLTREELVLYNKLCREMGYKNWREWAKGKVAELEISMYDLMSDEEQDNLRLDD